MTLHTRHTLHLVQRLGAAVGICVVLVAAPLLLNLAATLVPSVSITWPPMDTGPFAAPLTDQWRHWGYHTFHALRLDLGLSGLVLLAVLGSGWLAWATAVWWTVCDLTALARHGAHHLHQHTGPRGWMTALLTTLVLTSIAAPAHATPNTPNISRQAEPEHGDAQRTPERSDAALPLVTGGHPDPPVTSTPHDQQPTYRVQPGDTLTSIAATHLGHPDHWHQLAQHNPHIDHPDHLEPGQLLTLPHDTSSAGPVYTVTVQRGDTLSTVAERELGGPEQWDELFTLNAGRTQPDGLTLAHPDILLPGWHLLVPDYTPPDAPEPADEPPPTPQPTPTVQPEPVPTSPPPSQHDPAATDPGAETLAATSAALAAATAAAWHQHHRHRRPARQANTVPKRDHQRPVPAIHPVSLPHTPAPHACGQDFYPTYDVPDRSHDDVPGSDCGPEPSVDEPLLVEPTPADLDWPDTAPPSESTPSPPVGTATTTALAATDSDEQPAEEHRPLGLNVLGRVSLHHHLGTGEPQDLTSTLAPKQVALVLFLALHPRGASRESVRDVLWPDARGSRPYNSFHAMLSQLRKALHHRTHGEISDLVVCDAKQVRLDRALVEVDYWQFLDADHARRNTTDETERFDACARLVRSYHGALGDELSEPWLEAPREAAHRTVVDALSALTAHYRHHDPERALHTLEHARLLAPTNEAIYRDIMRTQATLNRPESIHATLHLLTTTLADIGERPQPSTRELARTLQRHDPQQ